MQRQKGGKKTKKAKRRENKEARRAKAKNWQIAQKRKKIREGASNTKSKKKRR